MSLNISKRAVSMCVALAAAFASTMVTSDLVLAAEYVESFHYGKEANQIAIDRSPDSSAGDVYIVGYHLGVVKFNSRHEFIETLPGTNSNVFGVTIDQSNGDVYVSNFETGTVAMFDAVGKFLSACSYGRSQPTALAFDQASRDLYVMFNSGSVVDKVTPPGAAGPCNVLYEISGTPLESFGYSMYGGLAVDQSSGDIYVGDSRHEVVDEFTASGQFVRQITGAATRSRSFAPSVKLDVAVDQTLGDVYVDDEGHQVVDEFSSSGSYQTEFNGAETPGGSFETSRALAVDQATSDIYVADSSGSQEPIPNHELVDVFRPIRNVVTGTASNVGPTSATLNGTVNPKGVQPASCAFAYGPAAEPYSHTVACAQSPEEIGAGEAPVLVSAEVTGLTQGTAYHFRLVTNVEGGADRAFVTPVPPTVDGEAVTDVASTSATFSAQINPGGGETSYRFEYGPDATYGASVPVPEEAAGSGTVDVSALAHPQDLAAATVYHFRVVAVNAAGVAYGPDEEFRTQPPGGPLVLPDGRVWELVSPPNKNGASIFTSGQGGGGGAALQASIDGNAISYSALGALGEGAAGNALISQVLSRRGPDGWSSQNVSTPHEQQKGATFLPEFHFFSLVDLSSAIVIPLDEPPLVPGGVRDSAYVRDNVNGTFTLLEGLEGERTEEEWAKAMERWYAEQVKALGEWYAQHEGLTLAPSPCDASTAPTGGGTVLGSSYDGCDVYFVSGAYNLYHAHESAGGWTTTPIATLSGDDERDWAVGPEYAGTSVRVSPNGRYLAFMSDRSLTGYDNTDASSPPGEPRHDEEVFLYDASTTRLVCASCNPTGARPEGLRVPEKGTGFIPNPGPLVDYKRAWEFHWLAGSLTAARNTKGFPSRSQQIYYRPRNLSDSGRLFFDSPDALAQQDTNGREDVYEYEPEGSGCQTTSTTFSGRAGGCVSLVSSGLSDEESAFLDASASGSDVFFLTGERLTSQDYDTSFDVYDAHVCSVASPCATAPVPLPPCVTSDSCKPSPSPQPPIFGAPPSATFSGAGNVVQPRPRALTRAQKFARALRACRQKPRKKRRACEANARRAYRATKAGERKKRRSK